MSTHLKEESRFPRERLPQSLDSTSEMTTSLYPTFRKRIDDAVEQLINEQVTPWAFLTSGPQFRIKSFDRRQIAYEGIGFEGSPRHVFWSGYIEPFLEDLCLSEINVAVTLAKEKGVDTRLLLPEVRSLLSAGISKVYERMAEVDGRLRRKSYLEKVELKSVDSEILAMKQFLNEHIRAELSMWKPTARVEEWYEKNKFWVWLIGILLSLMGLWAKFG